MHCMIFFLAILDIMFLVTIGNLAMIVILVISMWVFIFKIVMLGIIAMRFFALLVIMMSAIIIMISNCDEFLYAYFSCDLNLQWSELSCDQFLHNTSTLQ